MRIERPLIVLDLESTGPNASTDRIVQIGLIRVHPTWHVANNVYDEWKTLVNPGVPIPKAATDIHGITNEMVADQPKFSTIAQRIKERLDGCDFAGFDLLKFDLPMLSEEFSRAGIDWDIPGVRVIDAGNIFKKKHPRTLAAAVKIYADKEHEGAHDALADSIATFEVLLGQLQAHDDLAGMTIDELAKFSQHGLELIDIAGKLIRDADGDAVYNFGPQRGKKVREETGFGYWMLQKDFSANTKRHLAAELERIEGLRNAYADSFLQPEEQESPTEEEIPF